MIDAPKQRPPRPLGAAVLAVVLLLGGAVLLLDGVVVASRHPAAILTGPSLLRLALNWFLPAIWLGTTGVGMFRGASWARASFFAIAALALVVAAGLASRKLENPRDYQRLGAAISIALVAGGGIWYLLRENVKGWFR